MRSPAFLVGLFLAGIAGSALRAEVRLPAVFSDHAVLQRSVPVRVWGTADAGEAVAASLGGAKRETKADADGCWRVEFPPPPEGRSLELWAKGATNERVARDLVAGEVWLCSGQSNMEWPVRLAANAKQVIAAAANSDIRLLRVPKKGTFRPAADIASAWQTASPDTVPDFSAVGYFFARHLHRALGVPVGVIDASVGGSSIEAWIALPHVRALPGMEWIDKNGDSPEKDRLDQFEREMRAWQQKTGRADPGNTKLAAGWANAGFDDSAWPEMVQPGRMQAKDPAIPPAAVVWFRRAVDLPAAPTAAARLTLGAIDDFDVAYMNGVKVGETNLRSPMFWAADRVYEVPANLLRAGRNVLAVRVHDHGGGGGFTGAGSPMALTAGATRIPLDGPWRYAIEHRLTIDESVPPPTQPAMRRSTEYFNAMIAPLAPFALRGVLWYQGETNVGEYAVYPRFMRALAASWRESFREPRLPFLVVQLPNFGDRVAEPVQKTDWTEIRAAQARMIPQIAPAALAVTIDLGEAKTIHPANKQDVARRLGLLAERTVYGRDVVGDAPAFESWRAKGDRAVVRFTHVGKGLRAKGGSLLGFALRDEGGPWRPATARLVAPNEVDLVAEGVEKPAAVRYAWAANPATNLVNDNDLAAAPFATDLP